MLLISQPISEFYEFLPHFPYYKKKFPILKKKQLNFNLTLKIVKAIQNFNKEKVEK